MKLYIPDQYKNRTEYKLLSDWHETIPIKLQGLKEKPISESHILVLVGRLCKNLKNSTINILRDWTFLEGKQLICVPSWKPIELDKFFDLNINLKVKKNANLTWEKYNFINFTYDIDSTLQNENILKTVDGNVLTINYKKHQYSGILTVTTIPLLDFNLLSNEKVLKTLFIDLLSKETKNLKGGKQKDTSNTYQLSEVALYLLLLAAADISLQKNLKRKLQNYFNKDYKANHIHDAFKNLITSSYFNQDKKITDKGLNYIKHKGYRPYVKEVKYKKKSREND